jgi:hypothetical protein
MSKVTLAAALLCFVVSAPAYAQKESCNDKCARICAGKAAGGSGMSNCISRCMPYCNVPKGGH